MLVDLIDRAKESIHLQVYIYENDETGMLVTHALMRAAQRGVKVYLLLDGYASRSLSSDTIIMIREADIYFRWFEPLFKTRNFYIGRRMHHKIFVADKLYSLTGGINIGDRYNDMPDEPAWLDWAAYVEGEASAELYNRCVQVWSKGKKQVTHSPERTLFNDASDCFVRVRINDWVRNRNQVSRSYIEMLQRATSHITIVSSYFMPGRVFRKHLRMAAKRGVRIRIVLTQVSDVPMAKWAERIFYAWLLKWNIEIYEYRKNILHGKMSTYDGHWVTVGSFNFNDLSAYASMELNLDIHNIPFTHQVNLALEEMIRQDCDPITEETFTRRTHFWNRVGYLFAYKFFRLCLFLFTFYLKQDKVKAS